MFKEHGVVKTVYLRVDDTVTRVTTGLNINDLRSTLAWRFRRAAHPRVKPHTESAIFHIWPSFYHEAVTKFYPRSAWHAQHPVVPGRDFNRPLLDDYYTPAPGVAYTNMLRF